MGNQIGVVVTRVVRHLQTDPVRKRDGLILVVDFDLGCDESEILALEFIHLPDQTAPQDTIAGLLYKRLFAKPVEHLARICDRDLVLIFGSGRARSYPLDRDVPFVADSTDADSAFFDGAEVALTVAFAAAEFAPALALDQELRSISFAICFPPLSVLARVMRSGFARAGQTQFLRLNLKLNH